LRPKLGWPSSPACDGSPRASQRARGLGNKRAILTELIDIRVAGFDHAGSLPDSDDWQAMERESAGRSPPVRRERQPWRCDHKVMAATVGADQEIAGIYQQQPNTASESRLASHAPWRANTR
jgi:hypothetical protein